MRTIFRRFLYGLSVVTIASLACGTSAPLASAGVVTGPTAEDTFFSSFKMGLRLLPGYTQLGQDVCVVAEGNDFPGTQAHVIRELNAFNGFFGTDTVNTEFKSMHLAGSVVGGCDNLSSMFIGTPVEFRVGQGNGFLPSLGVSNGQVAEVSPTPTNGQLDVFPAKSVFDLFVDVWVDINHDNSVDFGEVLRNFDYAARMSNSTLTGLPPTAFQDSYNLIGNVWIGDPLLGEFGANVLPLPIDFYVVNLDGTTSGILAAQLGDCPCASEEHIITPEPSSMAIFGGLTLLAGRRRLQGLRKRLFGR